MTDVVAPTFRPFLVAIRCKKYLLTAVPVKENLWGLHRFRIIDHLDLVSRALRNANHLDLVSTTVRMQRNGLHSKTTIPSDGDRALQLPLKLHVDRPRPVRVSQGGKADRAQLIASPPLTAFSNFSLSWTRLLSPPPSRNWWIYSDRQAGRRSDGGPADRGG